MASTKIEWTNKSWNYITGCTKISAGCANCYARSQAFHFLRGKYGYPQDDPFKPATLHADKLREPLSWKTPQMVFCNSMGDTFHDDVPFQWIENQIQIMLDTPHHTYQLLTKRIVNMLRFFREWWRQPIPRNLWLGVTVENQAMAALRIPPLLELDVRVRFVSVEPMLSELDLRPFLPQLQWVICGGETGAGARPMQVAWARALREQCRAAGVPFFFKKLNAKTPHLDGETIHEYPEQQRE